MPISLIRVAARGVLGSPIRSAAVFLAVAASAGSLYVLALMYAGIHQGLALASVRLGADAIAHSSDWRPANAGGLLMSSGFTSSHLGAGTVSAIKNSPDVEAASAELFLSSAKLPCCSIANVTLVGFEPESDFTVRPWLKTSLGDKSKGDKSLGPTEIIVGSDILSEPGGRIRFYDSVFIIAGKLEPTGMPYMDSAVFMDIASARKLRGTSGASAVMVRFRPGVSTAEAAMKMEYAIPGITLELSSVAVESARRQMVGPLRWLALMAALQWCVTLVLIAALEMAVSGSRKSEAELLRALGARHRDVAAVYLLEAGMVLVAGGITGLLFATVALRLGFSEALVPAAGLTGALLPLGAGGWGSLFGFGGLGAWGAMSTLGALGAFVLSVLGSMLGVLLGYWLGSRGGGHGR